MPTSTQLRLWLWRSMGFQTKRSWHSHGQATAEPRASSRSLVVPSWTRSAHPHFHAELCCPQCGSGCKSVWLKASESTLPREN